MPAPRDPHPDPIEQRLYEALLCQCAAGGVRSVTVAATLERAGLHRASFYRRFPSKAEAFDQAYEHACAELAARIASAADAPSWEDSVSSALRELLGWVDERPLVARCVLGDGASASARTAAARRTITSALVAPLDAGREGVGEREQPPDLTATVCVGGIDALVREALARGGAAIEILPDAVELVVLAYRGPEAAGRAGAAARDSPRRVR